LTASPSRIIALLLFFLIVLKPVSISSSTTPPTLIKQTAFGDGLVYEQYNHPSVGEFHLVRLKLSSRMWRVQPAINPTGITKATSAKNLAIQTNPDAVCAINASFFDPGYYPVGTVAIHGQIVSLDNRYRSMLGFKDSGGAIVELVKPEAFVTPDDYFEPIWLWGYNHPPKRDSIIAYNYHWGSSLIAIPKDGIAVVIENGIVTNIINRDSAYIPNNGLTLIFRGQSKEHLKRFQIGSNVTVGLAMPVGWEKVTDIITGGPRLIDNGRIVNVRSNREGFESSFFKNHRRSITGLTWNDEVFFALFSTPTKYESAAAVLLEINVMDAIGLDGGSSSSMWVKGIRNINGGKKIPVALAVLPRQDDEPERQTIPFFKDIFQH